MSEPFGFYRFVRGKRQWVDLNHAIDVRAFLGTPGFSMLVCAANTHLPVEAVNEYLRQEAQRTPGVERTRSWVQRRRWMFQRPGTDNSKSPQADVDGNAARALKIMSENPKLSVSNLALLLKGRGIDRSREWVRQHRVAMNNNSSTHITKTLGCDRQTETRQLS